MRPVPAHWRVSFLVVLAAAALFQLVHGFRPPMNLGGDFQWVGVRLLLHHVDPWAAKLAGFHNERFSPPNYLHELYIFMMPLGSFRFQVAIVIWQVFTLLLSVGIVVSLCRTMQLSWGWGAVLLLLFWASNPFRVTLAMGQQSMLELYMFCLFFELRRLPAKGLALGLSYAKYSFSPVIFLFLAFRRHFKLLAFSLIVPLIGLFTAWLMVGGSFVHLALEPFLVSRLNVCSGFSDVMTITDRLLSWTWQPMGGCVEAASPLSYFIGLGGSLAYALWLSRRRFHRDATMALLALAPLLFLRHLIYDSVFLLVPLAYLMKRGDRQARWVAGGMIFLFWYAYRLLGLMKTPNVSTTLLLLNALLLAASIVVIDQCASKQAQNGQDLVMDLNG